MATNDQIKYEIFVSLLKRHNGPAINDVVVEGVVRVGLNKKYQYHLTQDEFYNIGDKLVEAGCFKWNDDGRLALTPVGLDYLSRLKYKYCYEYAKSPNSNNG